MKLQDKANGAADTPDETITSKEIMPPTGTKRTFYSLHTYAWPPNGNYSDFTTPWEIRDGYMYLKARWQLQRTGKNEPMLRLFETSTARDKVGMLLSHRAG